MRKMLLVTVLLAVTSLFTYAQDDILKGARGKMDRMLKDLDLTSDQQTKLQSINQDFQSKSKALNTERRAAIDKILTADQQSKWKEKTNRVAGLNQEGKAKLGALKDTFKKEKQAINRSRIAPEAQARKLEELKTKFKKDKVELLNSFKS